MYIYQGPLFKTRLRKYRNGTLMSWGTYRRNHEILREPKRKMTNSYVNMEKKKYGSRAMVVLI